MKKSFILGILVFVFSFFITNSVYAVGNENNLNAKEKKIENRQMKVVDTTLNDLDEDVKKVKDQKENKNKEDDKSSMGEQRRSQVANAVHEMLQVADRSGGIGEQVRIIAQSQVQNHEGIEEEIEEIKDRSSFSKFFIGPKYEKIEKAKELLKQDKEKINKLEELKASITNEADKIKVTEQIDVIKKALTEVENIINEEQKGFSLFGWLAKMF